MKIIKVVSTEDNDSIDDCICLCITSEYESFKIDYNTNFLFNIPGNIGGVIVTIDFGLKKDRETTLVFEDDKIYAEVLDFIEYLKNNHGVE